MSVLGELIEATTTYGDDGQLADIGHEMFRMYTEGGFPPDMFLSELGKRMELPLLAKIYVTSVYQTDFLEHRRLSGIQAQRLEKLRKRNREDIERLIKTGELGIY